MLDFFTSDWVVMVRCLNTLTSDWIVMVTCWIFWPLIGLSWSGAWILWPLIRLLWLRALFSVLWLNCHGPLLVSMTSDWIVMVTCLILCSLIGLSWPHAWFSDLWLDCHGIVLDSLTSDWIAMTTRLSFIWQETSLSMFTFCRCTWSPWIDSIYWRVSTFLFPEERKHTVPFPVYIWLFLPRRNLGKFDILHALFHAEEKEHMSPFPVYVWFILF